MDKKHFYRVGSHSGGWDDLPSDLDQLDKLVNGARRQIEPWLSAVFQAEHLNLLLGSGFTVAVGRSTLDGIEYRSAGGVSAPQWICAHSK